MPDGTKPTPTHTPRTTMINFRAPVELDERLTALAIDRRTTKTTLLLNAVERLLQHSQIWRGENEG